MYNNIWDTLARHSKILIQIGIVMILKGEVRLYAAHYATHFFCSSYSLWFIAPESRKV